MEGEGPVAIVVHLEVEEARLEEFVKIINFDVQESRKEEGCIRFDVVREQGSTTKFGLFEVYKNKAGMEHHMTTPHLQQFMGFKESGGFKSIDIKMNTVFDVAGAQ